MTVSVRCGNPTCSVHADTELGDRDERQARGDLVRALVRFGWRPDPQSNSVICPRCAEDL